MEEYDKLKHHFYMLLSQFADPIRTQEIYDLAVSLEVNTHSAIAIYVSQLEEVLQKQIEKVTSYSDVDWYELAHNKEIHGYFHG